MAFTHNATSSSASSASQMEVDSFFTVLVPAQAITPLPVHFLIDNFEDDVAAQQLLQEGAQIMRGNQSVILQIRSRIMAVRHSPLETLRTFDDNEVTEQTRDDYLQDLEDKLQSYTHTIDEQRSLLHELQQLHNSFSAVSTNATPSKPESKEKDLTFPKDL
ncbi:hypothetical protein BGX21_007637, partial [Mortierella sp. AD011]